MKRIVTGGLIGLLLVGMLPTVALADSATCVVNGYTVTYDGSPHLVTGGSCTDPSNNPLTGTFDFTATSHTDANTYLDAWSFTDDSNTYTDAGVVTDVINKAAPDCSAGYTATFDGNPHTATSTCTGVGGSPLTADLSGTTHTSAGTYSDTASVGDPNYQNAAIVDVINKAAPNCSAGYTVTFDGNPHTATSTCTGVGGSTLTPVLSGTTHTSAGTYSDSASMSDPNYQNATIVDVISQAAPNCSVTPYTVPYDGSAHTATGSCTGVGGATLSGLDLSGTSHTNVGTFPDSWSFTDASGNYKGASGTVSDVITLGANSITFTTHPPSSVNIGDTYTVAATAAQGGAVTFSIDASTARSCSLVGSTVSFSARGGCMIDASVPASGNYAAATAHQSIAIADSPPSCQAASVTVVMNVAKSGTPACNDKEGDYPLSFEVATQPTQGKVAFVKGQWTYTPSLNAVGSDTFAYLALDSLGAPSSPFTVTVTIVNRPVRARNDTVTTPAVVPAKVSVLANDLAGYSAAAPTVDQDPGQPLRIIAVGTGKFGSVTTDGHTITYDPNGCATGTDLVSYTASDGLTTSQAYVAITILRPGNGNLPKTPLTDIPSIAFGVGAKLASTVPVKLGWCGATATSTRTYRVLQSSNGGKTFPTTVYASTAVTSAPRSLVLNATYQFEAKTTDTAGRSSVWVRSLRAQVQRIDDSSPTITYAGTWQTASVTGSSGGTEHTATAVDATATFHLATGVRSFALVSSKGTGRGSVDVVIDGVDAGTVSESASSAAVSVLLLARGVDPSVAHTVVIRPVGNGPISLDAILTMQ